MGPLCYCISKQESTAVDTARQTRRFAVIAIHTQRRFVRLLKRSVVVAVVVFSEKKTGSSTSARVCFVAVVVAVA